ncbi:hypothetical protein HK097_010495 [Rhizophlyctis rosea]|uniref:Uncharacterized protein n=1 Tax=Rhizophlyctis rosea TaxID=64517 RepID=A0AAD5WZR0_9FUNG|nr:hypothetical protein HK097_010495 [Rhizophlyctis rosea]
MTSVLFKSKSPPQHLQILELNVRLDVAFFDTVLALIGSSLRRLALAQLRNHCVGDPVLFSIAAHCPDLETSLLDSHGDGQTVEGFVEVLGQFRNVKIGWCDGLPTLGWEDGRRVMEWLREGCCMGKVLAPQDHHTQVVLTGNFDNRSQSKLAAKVCECDADFDATQELNAETSKSQDDDGIFRSSKSKKKFKSRERTNAIWDVTLDVWGLSEKDAADKLNARGGGLLQIRNLALVGPKAVKQNFRSAVGGGGGKGQKLERGIKGIKGSRGIIDKVTNADYIILHHVFDISFGETAATDSRCEERPCAHSGSWRRSHPIPYYTAQTMVTDLGIPYPHLDCRASGADGQGLIGGVWIWSMLIQAIVSCCACPAVGRAQKKASRKGR